MKEKNKKNKQKKPHLILHSVLMVFTSLLLIVAVVISFATSSFSLMLNSVMGGALGGTHVDVSDEKIAATDVKALDLAEHVEEEGCVLLMNQDNVLPLDGDTKNVNVFGWASTAWLGGGSGSGGVSSVETDFLAALKAYGISYNTELTDMYEDFSPNREYASTLNAWPEETCRLYEPDINDSSCYTETLLNNAKEYSDTAFVVLGRLSGESNDAAQNQYKVVEKDGKVEVDDTRTYLDLSTEEEDLLAYVGENYENVVVILNTGNVMTLGQLETTKGIDGCLLAGYTGQYSATALPRVLWGDVSPSGKTADTWAYDFSTAPSYANTGEYGVGAYSNAEGLYPADGTPNGNGSSDAIFEQVSYVDYAEGIYVGYRWYETADAEGYWDSYSNEYGTGYDAVVQYPFGYGLSYTEFEWEIESAPENGAVLGPDDSVEISVKVTNTGDVAGKDVVELYYTAPYHLGEIEKSSKELIAFGKTDTLQPGESETVQLSFSVEDMASYDCYDANHNEFAGYELEAGEYILSVSRTAHDAEEIVTCNISENIQYDTETATGLTVSNKFTGEDAVDGVSVDGSDSEQNITYLTRADFEDTFPKENTDSRAMSDNIAEINLYTKQMAKSWIDENDEAVNTGVENGMLVEEDGVITDLGYELGADYENPKWEELMDELTVDEMENLVTHAYSHVGEVPSIGKSLTLDADGPSQIGGFTMLNAGTGFPAASVMAQTWNAELAKEEGRVIGLQASERGYSGWYAPAMNIHRSPLNGRNYEYYSEDALLSGIMCGNTVSGAKDSGIYCFIKHFICNDGESDIYRDGVYLWMTEQGLREIYLEPFRIAIEDYDATGLMSSYNRIGAVWTGGSTALLTGVLRDEWDFKGAVITDYSDHHAFMNGDQMLRAGGDLWMDGVGGELVCETESDSYMQALRKASKHIIYMYLNARVQNAEYAKVSGDDSFIAPVTTQRFPLWKKVVIGIDIVVVCLFALALWRLIKAVKLKKSLKQQIAENNPA